MGTGYIISDLHMMAGYSKWDKHWQSIEQAAAKADFFVINGDLYELYFTKVPFKDRIEKAISHLEEFVKSHPKCQFYYTIGNHEDQEDYKEELRLLQRRLPNNLVVKDNAFRRGNALFIHGDEVIDHHSISDSRPFYPEADATQRWRTAVLPVVNNFQHTFRKTRKKLRYPGEADLDLFLNAMSKADPEFRDGIEHVFYGHTHMPKQVENYKGSGVSFHNSGAGVSGATFGMLEIETDERDHVINVKSAFQEPQKGLAG